MKIEVINCVNKHHVEVNSLYGNFIGKWMDKKRPNVGIFDVEIDFHEIINYEVIDKRYYIGNNGGKNIICGLILDEGLDDDFIQYLDFSGNGKIESKNIGDNKIENIIVGETIIMVNITENNLKGKYIKLEVDEINLYPVFY